MAAQSGDDGASASACACARARRWLLLPLRVRRAVRLFTRDERLAPQQKEHIVKLVSEVGACKHDFARHFGRSGALILLGCLKDTLAHSDGLVVIRCLLLYAQVVDDSVLNERLLQSVYEQRFVLDKVPFVDGNGRHDVSVLVKTFSRYLLQLVNMRHVVMRVGGGGDCGDVVRVVQHGDAVTVVHLLAVALYSVQCAKDVLQSVAQCAPSTLRSNSVNEVRARVRRDVQALWRVIELAMRRVHGARCELSGAIAQEALQVAAHMKLLRTSTVSGEQPHAAEARDECVELCDALQSALRRGGGGARRQITADRVRQLNERLRLEEHAAAADDGTQRRARGEQRCAAKSVRFADAAAAHGVVVSDVRLAERVACARVPRAHVSR